MAAFEDYMATPDLWKKKVLDLLAAGTRTIWLLYPLIPCVVAWVEGRVAHVLGPRDTLPVPPGFPGLSVAIDRLFER
jgi:hypothetical protein